MNDDLTRRRPSPAAAPRRRQWMVTAIAIAASGLAAGAAVAIFGGSSDRAVPAPAATAPAMHDHLTGSTTAISRRELADRYGIKLTLVGVTAAGGLVDLRFKITDAKKARKLFTDASVMPAVVAEPTGTVLAPPHGGHHSHITPADGASYFVLIGNAGGTVQRGVPVSVVFNTVRVDHIRAET